MNTDSGCVNINVQLQHQKRSIHVRALLKGHTCLSRNSNHPSSSSSSQKTAKRECCLNPDVPVAVFIHARRNTHTHSPSRTRSCRCSCVESPLLAPRPQAGLTHALQIVGAERQLARRTRPRRENPPAARKGPGKHDDQRRDSRRPITSPAARAKTLHHQHHPLLRGKRAGRVHSGNVVHAEFYALYTWIKDIMSLITHPHVVPNP